jgi:oxygen-independent coproporphyrinogen-3 oxidase
MKETNLFAKYDVPAPRYTSYPTVPYWSETPSEEIWLSHLKETLAPSQASWSLYVHIPFCETLCTFCGCNTIITKDHKKETPYLEELLKEWNFYLNQVPDLKERPLQNIHLGGGTPTFFSAQHLKDFLTPLLQKIKKAPHFEGSVEVDPRRTTVDQLQVLRELGFNRISLGVQDFNPEIQRLVNRLQPFDVTQKITDEARRLGYESVNFDLIYGLAKQTLETMKITVEKTLEIRPDRIALYSFALVPWIKPAQRLFKDEDLPTGKAKRDLYEYARGEFLGAGYLEVGMDHFALPQEALNIARQAKTLHRNFMGYTDHRTDVLLGLGVSAISETPKSFHQNEKVLTKYQELLAAGHIPTARGHLLSREDQTRREQILKLMTQSEVAFADSEQQKQAEIFLAEMIQDGLVEISKGELRLTDKGRPFLRNACLFFDEHLKKHRPEIQIFSKSI